MPDPSGWDPAAAVASCRVVARRRSAWRAHNRKYAADDPGGSLRVSGRYNRGLDQFPVAESWPALYLALGQAICLGEVLRHLTPDRLLTLANYRLTELQVTLSAVIDCRNVDQLGLALADLCDDLDYRVPQSLAAAAITRGVEAMLVPSAARLGDNLVVFPHCLRPSSRITVVRTVDPRLIVGR
jgi:RES domain-containing protein